MFLIDIFLNLVENIMLPYYSISRTSKTLETILEVFEMDFSKLIVVLKCQELIL